jgi:hypothetical protein
MANRKGGRDRHRVYRARHARSPEEPAWLLAGTIGSSRTNPNTAANDLAPR